MVVVMQEGATEDQVQKVIDRLIQMGFDVHRSTGASHTVLGAVGGAPVDHRDIELLDGVREVVKISASYKLASRAFKPDGTVVKVGPPGRQVEIGGRDVVMMAGPCTVESAEQIMTIAGIMKENGIKVLRGGAFKPRTSPYSFQGMGEEGLKVLRDAADRHGLIVVSEIMNQTQIPILVDPSHGTGRRDKVAPMARAAVAAGADGLLIEVHHSPESALCDGAQSLYPAQFRELMSQLHIIAPAVQRTMV